MAVSKRLRFEILRRDGHRCRYCGATAPDVPLTVDHVVPVALGGQTVPENLVAACGSCNAGKSSVCPDAPIVADVAADAVRWASARRAAALDWELEQAEKSEAISRQGDDFLAEWSAWKTKEGRGKPIPLPCDWRESIFALHSQGLTDTMILSAIPIAMNRRIRPEDAFRYFMGICWNRVSDLARRTREAVQEQDAFLETFKHFTDSAQ